MNIAIAFSPNWLSYVLVEIYAILKTNPAPLKIYLVSDYLSAGDINKIKEVFDTVRPFDKGYEREAINLDLIFPHKVTSDVNVDGRFTKYALYRLLFPEVIHEDKILHIDADAIVNGDLTELYNTDLGDNIIAGAVDTGITDEQKAVAGLRPSNPYVNAGVLLMNLAKIREENLVNKWLYEINTTWYSCHDQDVINMTAKGRAKLIDSKFNVSLSTSLDVNPKDIMIMHYAGAKPWNTSDVPFPEIWENRRQAYAMEVGI